MTNELAVTETKKTGRQRPAGSSVSINPGNFRETCQAVTVFRGEPGDTEAAAVLAELMGMNTRARLEWLKQAHRLMKGYEEAMKSL